MPLLRHLLFLLPLTTAALLALASPGRVRMEIHHHLAKDGEKMEFIQTRSELHAYWLPLLLVGGQPNRTYSLEADSLRVRIENQDVPLTPGMSPPPDVSAATWEQGMGYVTGKVAWQCADPSDSAIPFPDLPEGFLYDATGSDAEPARWPAYLAAAACILLAAAIRRRAERRSATASSAREWLRGLRVDPRTRSRAGTSSRRTSPGMTETLRDLGGLIGEKVRDNAIMQKSGDTIGHGLRIAVRTILRR